MSFQFVSVSERLFTVANLRLGRMDASLVIKESFPRGERLVLRALTTSEFTIVIPVGRTAGDIFCSLKATQNCGGSFTANLHFNCVCVDGLYIYTITHLNERSVFKFMYLVERRRYLPHTERDSFMYGTIWLHLREYAQSSYQGGSQQRHRVPTSAPRVWT